MARKRFTNQLAYDREVSAFQKIVPVCAHPYKQFVVNHIRNFSVDSYWFIDMELAERDLRSVAIHNGTPTHCPEFRSAEHFDALIKQCLSGLVFLHNVVHVAHNDIKPVNILMFANGVAKLGDLGLATDLESTKKIGTLNYTAPEIFNYPYREAAGHNGSRSGLGKTDVFSLGVSMMFVSEGRHAYEMPHRLQNVYSQTALLPDRLASACAVSFAMAPMNISLRRSHRKYHSVGICQQLVASHHKQ